MSTTPTPQCEHPLAVLVERLHADLDTSADVPVWSPTAAETGRVLSSLTRLAARVTALELQVADHGVRVRVEDQDGSISTANWWAHQTRATRAETHRKTRLAEALAEHPVVAAAFGAGQVLPDQAAVIVNAVDALPSDLDADLVEKAEAHLVDLAAEFDAKALRLMGRSLLSVVAPDSAEAHEAAALAKEERHAAAAARFSMVDDGHGCAHGRFTVPTAQGAMLKKALLALAAPKHQAATTGQAPEPRPSAEKLGAAFCEYIENYPTDRLPQAGGTNATVVVTMALEQLLKGMAPASLDTGETISAGQARRLACEAGIIPTVLGGASVPLDLGRTRRFHTKAQRVSLGLRDGGCTAEGCDWPPGLCHAHHETPWHHGGHTDTTTGRLLCPRHHARALDPTYEVAHLPGGKVAFTRRE